MEKDSKIKNLGIFWEGEKIGGVDSYLYYLINSEIFRKINIVIFTNKNNLGAKKLLKRLNQENIKIIYFNSLNSIDSNIFLFKIFINLIKPILFLFSIFQIYFVLRKYTFDVFVGQCGGYGDFRSEMASMIVAKYLNFKVRTLVIHHSAAKPMFWNTFLNILNNIISKILTSVIFVSKATRDSVLNKTNLLDRSSDLQNVIIYNGVPVNQEAGNISEINNIISKNSKDLFLLGMLSRIESYKGHKDLIKAFNTLPKNIQNKLKIYFIGDGSNAEIEKLKKLIISKNLENYFIFTGYIDLDSISIVSKLDLLMSLTVTFEGFGLSIAEAMSVETPVLVTKVGAVTEYLNQDNSKLIDASNIGQITEALNDFVLNKKLWDRRAKVAKDNILKNFTSELMAKNYFNHFMQNLY